MLTIVEFQLQAVRFWFDAGSTIMNASLGAFMPSVAAGEERGHGTRQAPPSARTSTARPWWMPPESPVAVSRAPALPWWLAPLSPPTPEPAPATRPSELAAAFLTPWMRIGLAAAPAGTLAPWLAGRSLGNDTLDALAAPFRQASGHASAAMLRAMADAVDPMPAPAPSLVPFWPYLR